MLQHYENENEYTIALLAMQKDMIREYKNFVPYDINDKKLIQSFEATIGSKAPLYADIRNLRYFSAEEYRNTWFEGLISQTKKYDNIRKLMRNEILRIYAILFIERSFLNNKEKYQKEKIKKNECEIFLGNNNKVFGIFIAPRQAPDNEWYSYDVKKLKVKYNYLTLGQLVSEGILEGHIREDGKFNAQLIKITNFDDIRKFYDNFKKSGSPFEPAFIDEYIKYAISCTDWKNVPILLPEVRWNKKFIKHKYRVDYLIINYVNQNRLAIELSPVSTHLNENNLHSDWKRENDKRNDYLFEYGVPTITYTDDYLPDIATCFKKISNVFNVDKTEKLTFENIIAQL